MKQTVYASLFLGLGLTFAVASIHAKTTQAPEKKQASVKIVKTESKKPASANPVAKKTTVSKKPELDKISKPASSKASKIVAETKNSKVNKTVVDKNQHGKKTPAVADIKDNKQKTKMQTVAQSKPDPKDKHAKTKSQPIASKEDKHSDRKSYRTAAEAEQDVAKTNATIENSVEQNTQNESEQTAVYEPEPIPATNIEQNNPPLITSVPSTPTPQPLFPEPPKPTPAPTASNTLSFSQTKPIMPASPAKPAELPLMPSPSNLESDNRVHTLINKGTAPQMFGSEGMQDNSTKPIEPEMSEPPVSKNKRIHSTVANRNTNFISDANTQESNAHVASTHGVVEGSLNEAAAKAGLSEDMVVELTEVFAWDIDFANNLQAGDKFTVVYDNNASNKNRIVAAEFVNRGKAYRAIRYKSQDGIVSYYAPDGHSLRKAFLTTPVDFARVSSHFSTHRHHPILNRIRAHKGVDYAARTGTPVKAAGDGVVTFRGTQGGYGNMIVLSHGEHYETAYAHLSNFHKNLQEGQPVKQGDVIGYVGQSGLATGPHLHYEFRVDGQHQDPEKLDSSQGARLSGDDWDNFHSQTVPVLTRLNAAKVNNSNMMAAETKPVSNNE